MNIVIAIAIAILGGFVYLQPVKWLIESWRFHPYYQYGFLVILVSIVLTIVAVVRSKEKTGRNFRWICFLVLSAVLYLAGLETGLNYLKAVPIFFTLLSIVYLLGAYLPADKLCFPILFPIIAIPIPFLAEVTALLQFVMVHISTWLLRIVGFEIISEGVTVYLPNGTFMIGEPSSGIQSLIALVTLMILAVYFTNTSLKKKIFLCLLTVPIAMISNLIRILVLLTVGHYYGEEIAINFWHDIGNVMFFTFALILLFIFWYLTVYGYKFKKRK